MNSPKSLKASKGPSFFVVGLALFSMFFGSGNLIFPLYVGQLTHVDWGWGSLGFLIAGVLLPFLGVIAMIAYKGDYTAFFATLGKPFGAVLSFFLLTIWIPLGSGPRCMTLSQATLESFFPMPSVWIFGVIYSFIIFLLIYKRNHILDILGYVLTPILIICLGAVILVGISISTDHQAGEMISHPLPLGIIEGYNTMDLISSFFFSASVIGLLRKRVEASGQNAFKLIFKACIVGMTILSLVYIGLIYLAASHFKILEGIRKEQLLSYLAKVLLEPYPLKLTAALAIVLACMTTSIALVIVYADYLSQFLFQGKLSRRRGVLITLVITFVMSIFGLEGVTIVTSPALQVCYPILVFLIFLNGIKGWLKKRRS